MAYNTNLVTNKDFDLKMTKVPSGLSNGGDIVM